MSEKFSEYRQFAESAKESGFDEDERRLIATDPTLLLEATSKDINTKITPKMLQSFFGALQADKKINPRNLIDIGNVLYKYRFDDRAQINLKSGLSYEEKILNESDKKLIDLGCRLIENSFYAGNLINTDNEGSEESHKASALTFIINNLTKIIGDKNNNDLKGFDKEKFTNFINQVSEFEDEGFIKDLAGKDKTADKEKTLENINQQLASELALIKKLEENTDWGKYINNLEARFNEALIILEETDDDLNNEIFIKSLHNVLESWPIIIDSLKSFTIKLQNHLEKTDPNKEVIGRSDRLHVYSEDRSLIDYAFDARNLKANSKERIRAMDDISWGKRNYRVLTKKIENNPDKKKNKFNDFSSFGKAETTKRLPEAMKTIGELFNVKEESLFNEYVSRIVKTFRTVRSRDIIVERDTKFAEAKKSILKKIDLPSTVPYFIKTCLITNDMGSYNIQVHTENNTSEPKKYLFHPTFDGYEIDAPKYASPHFIPKEVPLAAMALKYLTLKNKK